MTSTRSVAPSARTAPEPVPVLLPAAPTLPEPDAEGAGLTQLLPMTGAFSSVAMVVGAGPGGSGMRGLLMAAGVIASSLLLVLAQVVRQRTRRRRSVEQARASHLHQLRVLSARVGEAQEADRSSALAAWPHATDTPGPRPADGPLLVRVGIGTRSLRLTCTVGESGDGTPDPVCATALARFPTAHRDLAGMPVTVDLTGLRHLQVDGAADVAAGIGRSLLLQLARHSPDDVALAVLCPSDDVLGWDWLKWLPHARGDRSDAAGPVRLVDHRAPRLLARLPRRSHTVLVLAPGAVLDDASPLGPRTTVLSLGGHAPLDERPVDLRLTAEDDGTCSVADAPQLVGVSQLVADWCTVAEAAAAARHRTRSEARPPASGPLPPLDRLLAPPGGPGEQPAESLLRVPVGTSSDGTLIHLDLKESAHGGHGPHGLLVGATGSGKSELLRTVVLGLVASHRPDDLALVLVDFKGGATFADVEDLPHVAACVTNLSDDSTLVDRMQDALGGELERRQELLHAAGHANLHAYRAARVHDPSLPALPHLFVCVDEFSELLAARPEFVELFTTIGRLGRSLGVHLLLASQRLDEGRLHALEAHLSYRIALRTFSSTESRAAIGVPDAHTLPRRPGVGLFRTGSGEPTRFDALHVGAPHGTPAPQTPASWVLFSVLANRPARGSVALAAAEATRPGPTVAEVVLERTARALAGADRTHRIWLPPLRGSVPLTALVTDLGNDELLGLHSPALRAHAGLLLPFALIDRPRLQRLDVRALDLSGAGGHVAIVGGPRSGRSTTLQTLVCAIACGATPEEAEIHLIDLCGADLQPLTALPHVVSHTTRARPDLVLRVVEHLESVVEARTLAPQEGRGAVHVVVDGWGTLRRELEDVEARLVTLSHRALAVGVHLIVTGGRWTDFRPGFLDVLGSRVELRLGDPFDSLVNRRAADLVPHESPGRGLSPDGATMLVATPSGPDGTLTSLVEALARAWTGPLPARLKDLPDTVAATSLPAARPGHLAVGVDTSGATAEVPAHQHLVVSGPDGSGRTSALRQHVAAWASVHPTGQVLVVDPRGSLDGSVADGQLLGHAATSSEANTLVREVAQHLSGRLTAASDSSAPPVPVTVLVDDLDLLRTTGVDLSPLTPLLPRATSIGLRLVVACRGGHRNQPSDRLATLLLELGSSHLELTGAHPGRGRLHVAGTQTARSVQGAYPAPTEPASEQP